MGLVNNIFKKLGDTYFPIGTVYITKTNTNPGTIVGGTWTLKHRFLTSKFRQSNPNNCFTFNTTNISSGTFTVWYQQNTAWARILYVPKVSISDTAYQIGVMSTAIGGAFYANPNIIGHHTGEQYIALCSHGNATSTATTTALQVNDCIVRSGASSYSTGASVRMCFPVIINSVNTYCNQWHWVRTA